MFVTMYKVVLIGSYIAVYGLKMKILFCKYLRLAY